MAKELEIEFKNMLTETEYSRLLARFGFDREEAQAQTNHYFDTPDGQLKNKRCALRIRQKPGSFECTLKTPAPEGNIEITDSLTEDEAAAMLNMSGFHAPEVEQALTELRVDPRELQPFGALTTYRLETPFESGLLVLDRSEYSGITDYELEFEVPEAETGEKQFIRLLNTENIPLRPADKKIVRLVNSLQEGGNAWM